MQIYMMSCTKLMVKKNSISSIQENERDRQVYIFTFCSYHGYSSTSFKKSVTYSPYTVP